MVRKFDFAPPRLTKKNTKITIFQKGKKGVQIASYHSQAKPSLLASLGGRKKAPFLNAKKGVSRELKKCTF
jgi:hypothetical protein